MTSQTQKILIGLAIAAVVVLCFLGILIGAAVSGWRAAQRAGNEAATIQNLKTISGVETQYFNTHKRTYATFEDLIKEHMLSSRFADDPVTTDGYVFKLTVSPAKVNVGSTYMVTADPLDDSSGKNHFYLDSTSDQIRVNADDRASASDPPFDK